MCNFRGLKYLPFLSLYIAHRLFTVYVLFFYMLLLLEILASLSAVISIMIYGNKSWYAPLFGLCSQAVWVAWVYYQEVYSMFFLCLCMIIMHIRNFKKMGTIQKLKQIWSK